MGSRYLANRKRVRHLRRSWESQGLSRFTIHASYETARLPRVGSRIPSADTYAETITAPIHQQQTRNSGPSQHPVPPSTTGYHHVVLRFTGFAKRETNKCLYTVARRISRLRIVRARRSPKHDYHAHIIVASKDLHGLLVLGGGLGATLSGHASEAVKPVWGMSGLDAYLDDQPEGVT